mgnify:CR=1 FL=1
MSDRTKRATITNNGDFVMVVVSVTGGDDDRLSVRVCVCQLNNKHTRQFNYQ